MPFDFRCIRFASVTGVCLMSLAGCYRLQPVSGPVPAEETLQVRFATPTEVRLMVPGGDTGRMVLLREIRGKSRGVSGDTVTLDVSRARGAHGREAADGLIAVVTLGPGVQIETVHLDAAGTFFAAVGSVFLVALTAGVIAFWMFINSD